MIIPKTTQSINIGDKVTTIKEIDGKYCVITIGHEFNVIDYVEGYGQFICEDPINNIILQLPESQIMKKIDLQSAKNEYIFKQETNIYKEFIFKLCPNTDYEYSDRDRYNTCKLKNGYCYGSGNTCTPNLGCAKFLKKEDINKSFELLKHLRRVKIKELNKICLH